MIRINVRGDKDFDKTKTYLAKLSNISDIEVKELKKFGDDGLQSLEKATPKNTGLTSRSWYYKIVANPSKKTASIQYYNSNIQNGISVAFVVDVGHATETGEWIEGRHYINPALDESIKNTIYSVWKEVKKR